MTGHELMKVLFRTWAYAIYYLLLFKWHGFHGSSCSHGVDHLARVKDPEAILAVGTTPDRPSAGSASHKSLIEARSPLYTPADFLADSRGLHRWAASEEADGGYTGCIQEDGQGRGQGWGHSEVADPGACGGAVPARVRASRREDAV